MSEVLNKNELIDLIESLTLEIKSSNSKINNHRKQIITIETKLIEDMIVLANTQEQLRLLNARTIDRSMTERQKEVQEFKDRLAAKKDSVD